MIQFRRVVIAQLNECILVKKEKHQPQKHTYEELRNRFSDDEANYNKLKGSEQAVRERTRVWDTDYVLAEYASATDAMIGALDGSIAERAIKDPVNPERSTEAPDVAIFLDKSARPVSWLVDALWDQFAGEDSVKPDYDFLNIDRVTWFRRQGYSLSESESSLGPSDFDIDKVSDEDIARIRAIFVEGDLDRDNWQDDVWNLGTRLDGKNVLVVDEVKNKGGTLSIATQLLHRAIPEATFSGTYFWKSGRYALGNSVDNMQMESAPVWYSRESVWGRGIGDLSKAYYEQLPDTPENFKRQLGWLALSAPHHDPRTFEEVEDIEATRLLQDIAYLSYALADGKVLAMPSNERESEEVIETLEQRYPGIPVRDIVQYRARRSKENRP